MRPVPIFPHPTGSSKLLALDRGVGRVGAEAGSAVRQLLLALTWCQLPWCLSPCAFVPPNRLLLVNLDPPLFSTWLATVNLTSGSGYFPECNFWERCFCACHLSRSHYRSGSCPRPNHALVAAAMYLGVTSSRPPWGNPSSLPATSSSRQRSSS